MHIFSLTTLLAASNFLTVSLSTPLVPSLEHRQLGSCATAPCPAGLCCSIWLYCGTGPQYCQVGSCNGGVGGTCAAGLCCSKYGYCGSGSDFCPPQPTTTSTPIPTPTPTPSSSSRSTSTPSPSPSPGVNCGTTGAPCGPGYCCSVWGWCGSGPAFCGV